MLGNYVLLVDFFRVLVFGDFELGWLVKLGWFALGYLNDRAKTERIYLMIDGVRYGVFGDWVCLLVDGIIEVYGRDLVIIVFGGEKIFVEEVEWVLREHFDVYDCVVVFCLSVWWG